MRAPPLPLLLLLPSLALASAPAQRRAPPKPTARVSPTPPPLELDEATEAERDQALADAKHKADMAEFLEARELYRRAVELDPAHAGARSGLATVQAECLANARRQISEAKAYKAAFNYDEAKKALELALRYADDVTTRENQQARELLGAIRRETER